MVGNNNQATIYQGTDAYANTGNNVADRNISIGGSAGQIITGAASTKTSYLATANQSVVLIGGESKGKGPGSGATIITTGDRHSSYITNNTNRSTSVTNTNNAYVSQSCGVQGACIADTGNNNASGNINLNGDAGVIQTGDARVDVKLVALVNSAVTQVSGSEIGTASNTEIINTGNDSNFSSEINNNTNTNVENNNNAVVNQNVNAYANTGNNTANRNISFGGNAGVIQTGNAEVNVCLLADVNTSTTQIAQASPQPIAASTPTPTSSPKPSSTPKPSVTPKPSATPTPKPTVTPTPSSTPKPSTTPTPSVMNGGEDNGETNSGGSDPQSATTGRGGLIAGIADALGGGQVLAASNIFPETFADTGFNINWLGLLKTLIVLMIGYALGSVRHALLSSKN